MTHFINLTILTELIELRRLRDLRIFQHKMDKEGSNHIGYCHVLMQRFVVYPIHGICQRHCKVKSCFSRENLVGNDAILLCWICPWDA